MEQLRLKRFIKNFSVAFLLCSVNFPLSFNKNVFIVHGFEEGKVQLDIKTDNDLEDKYIIGPGDQLNLKLFDFPEYSGIYNVISDGTLNLPLLGAVKVNHLTLNQASEKIENLYKKEILRPSLFLNLEKPRPVKVSIIGEIERPGLYSLTIQEKFSQSTEDPGIQFTGLPTVVDAIQKAGGITQSADLRNVTLSRILPGEKGDYKRAKLDLLNLILDGKQFQNPFLQDGDIIQINKANVLSPKILEIASANLSPKTINVTIIGEVGDPGKIELPTNTPLIQGILKSGGPNSLRANNNNIQLVRINKDGTITNKKFKIDLRNGVSISKNPPLADGDIIRVNPSKVKKIGYTVNVITEPIQGLVTTLTLFKLLND